jgi:hypothetical protein
VKAKLLSPLLNLGHQPAHHLIEEDSTSSKNSVSSATTTKQGRVLGGLGDILRKSIQSKKKKTEERTAGKTLWETGPAHKWMHVQLNLALMKKSANAMISLTAFATKQLEGKKGCVVVDE